MENNGKYEKLDQLQKNFQKKSTKKKTKEQDMEKMTPQQLAQKGKFTLENGFLQYNDKTKKHIGQKEKQSLQHIQGYKFKFDIDDYIIQPKQNDKEKSQKLKEEEKVKGLEQNITVKYTQRGRPRKKKSFSFNSDDSSDDEFQYNLQFKVKKEQLK